jgi:hypothetical protein
MKIKAKTLSGKEVFIVDFLSVYDSCMAITVDGAGQIEEYNRKRLVVTDDEYLTCEMPVYPKSELDEVF